VRRLAGKTANSRTFTVRRLAGKTANKSITCSSKM